jgi:hypothetical protein
MSTFAGGSALAARPTGPSRAITVRSAASPASPAKGARTAIAPVATFKTEIE